MTAAYTPGPWVVDANSELPLAVIRDDENGEGVAEIGERTAENEANARLIAAAPELYAACQAYFNTPERANKMISDALAKAERGGL
jgi:hypothetical protein